MSHLLLLMNSNEPSDHVLPALGSLLHSSAGGPRRSRRPTGPGNDRFGLRPRRRHSRRRTHQPGRHPQLLSMPGHHGTRGTDRNRPQRRLPLRAGTAPGDPIHRGRSGVNRSRPCPFRASLPRTETAPLRPFRTPCVRWISTDRARTTPRTHRHQVLGSGMHPKAGETSGAAGTSWPGAADCPGVPTEVEDPPCPPLLRRPLPPSFAADRAA